MTPLQRLAALVLIAAGAGPPFGCGATGSSFETLGVPTAEPRPGRVAVIFGWAREAREGWSIQRIRIDDQTRSAWNEETQEPLVLYLEPGEHELRLSAAQLSNPRDPTSRPRRRYRLRPYGFDLLEGMPQLCVFRLGGDERLRPRVSCEPLEPPAEENEEEEMVTNSAIEDEDEEPAPLSTPAPAETSADSDGVPSPFDAASPEPPAEDEAQPEDEPELAEDEPVPAEDEPELATPAPAEEPLSLEERVERLERLVDEFRDQIGAQ